MNTIQLLEDFKLKQTRRQDISINEIYIRCVAIDDCIQIIKRGEKNVEEGVPTRLPDGCG